MKQLIYILSAMLFALFSCTYEVIEQEREIITEGNRVQVNFTVNDLPDFKVVTRAGGESAIASISLMTFAEDGSFLGRVEAKVTDTDTGKGTGSALVPLSTSTIHFIANYNWPSDDAYLTPNGETENSLMPALTTGTDNFFVAWGSTSNVDLSKTLSVDLLRNYAKVTVEKGEGSNFEVEGFALSHYANKGTVIVGEGTLNVAPGYSLINQSASDCLTNQAKYMYEYENTYDSQTSVIVKRQGVAQYYKIQLLDTDGNPYPIQRNSVYKVIIRKIDEKAKGSSTFAEALMAPPTNNIFVEVIKEAPTVSDKEGNRLTVDPVYHLFIKDGTLTFKANYYPRGSSTANNANVNVKLIHNGHQQTPILPDVTDILKPDAGGTITTRVTLPSDQTNLSLDSAVLRINAGVLTRFVTVFISKQYDFDPQPADYPENSIGQEIPFTYTIPSDFPETLFPLKCYIKADGLNPVKVAGQKDMLVEQRDGTIYHVYEAESTGTKTLKFKTIQSVVNNPTITNEYFADGTFILKLAGKNAFSNISAGPAYCENGSTFTLNFKMESDATVTISGNGIETKIISGKDGDNTATLTTTQKNATGTINLKADGYNDGSISYKNNSTLQRARTVEGELDCGYYGGFWGRWNSEDISSGTITTGNSNASAINNSRNHYRMTFKAGTSITETVIFTVKGNNKTYYSEGVTISNFLDSNKSMRCKRER